MGQINQTMFDYMRSYRNTYYGIAWHYKKSKQSLYEFLKKVDKVAGSFIAMGIRAGDCITICLPNIPQALTAFYAANRIGAVVSIVHPLTALADFQKQLEITKPKLCLLSEINYLKLAPALKGIKVVHCPVYLNKFVGLKPPVKFEPFHSDGENMAVYMHSGGTTGKSKTVALSNRACNSLVYNLFRSINDPYDERDGMLTVLPLFHGFGLVVGAHASMCSRMAITLMERFNAKKALKAVRKNKVTTLILIPRMLAKMSKEASFVRSMDGVKAIYVGGDTLSDELLKEVDGMFESAGYTLRISQGYGLTELGSVCVLNYGEHRAGSIGKALIGLDAKVVDENLSEVKDGEVGELVFSGDQLMSGYMDCDEQNQKLFFEKDGKIYLRTGDLVSKDKDGYIYFKGRKKRLIKISGINVFPFEIERAADEIEGIASSAAVIKRVNEKPYICLFVVLKEGKELDEEYKNKIKAELSKKLSHWSIPEFIYKLDSLPLTKLGKIDFTALEEKAKSL